MIEWLATGAAFPPVTTALTTPNGLLAASHDLTPERLLQAYQHGIFPWYSAGEPVLWWSPDPRMVLIPQEFRAAHSLRKTLRALSRSTEEVVVVDRDFEAVMWACAAPRDLAGGTWITSAVRHAYVALHRQGRAHSVEVRRGDELLGGLYGVSLGRMFFGESMFTRATDRSKVALAALVQILLRESVPMIDCQQETSHLASLGGRPIPRAQFCGALEPAVRAEPIDWSVWSGKPLNALLEAY